ncbi:hypothetical protein CQW23_09337 [Capsicum baccatum]|uniref:LRR receptor-like serine/threonine-protein kinase n=1 Tax=Capsicum baccatum TaxID=33114 RepID=A0A2G2WWM2_CAPBA|nr:hypothetical protein CQW23_09337 [Capsicum baccatum]
MSSCGGGAEMKSRGSRFVPCAMLECSAIVSSSNGFGGKDGVPFTNRDIGVENLPVEVLYSFTWVGTGWESLLLDLFLLDDFYFGNVTVVQLLFGGFAVVVGCEVLVDRARRWVQAPSSHLWFSAPTSDVLESFQHDSYRQDSREFGNLTFLVSLDLGSNNFNGNLPQEMTRLRRLKFLDLSFNSFSGKVPSWFGFLHQLQVLNLGNNSCTSSIPSSFSNISTLENLNLNFNSIEGQIPKVIGNIRVLKLRGNNLIESIPLSLSNASRIEFIAFTGNSLSGSLPNGLSSGLPILKGLYLITINEFDGPIHSEIGRLSNLQKLAVGTNHFTGIIPQEIGNLANLMELWMEGNQITGSVPISIFNISLLQTLTLEQNNLSGFLPREIGNLNKMQLLQISVNKLIGEIPKEISNLIELEVLNLGFNSFSGSLPPNMCSVLPNIEQLFLGILTNLVGTIPHSISNCSKLKLELSGNKLTGLIPNSLGYLTHLQFLNLGENNFTSDSSLSFLTSLTNCRNLTDLYLPFNPLNGMLPDSTGNLSISLRNFYAGNCKIKGRIPNEVGNLSSLLDLDLPRNNLVGSIPT